MITSSTHDFLDSPRLDRDATGPGNKEPSSCESPQQISVPNL